MSLAASYTAATSEVERWRSGGLRSDAVAAEIEELSDQVGRKREEGEGERRRAREREGLRDRETGRQRESARERDTERERYRKREKESEKQRLVYCATALITNRGHTNPLTFGPQAEQWQELCAEQAKEFAIELAGREEDDKRQQRVVEELRNEVQVRDSKKVV
jgi:hypothetical protein